MFPSVSMKTLLVISFKLSPGKYHSLTLSFISYSMLWVKKFQCNPTLIVHVEEDGFLKTKTSISNTMVCCWGFQLVSISVKSATWFSYYVHQNIQIGSCGGVIAFCSCSKWCRETWFNFFIFPLLFLFSLIQLFLSLLYFLFYNNRLLSTDKVVWLQIHGLQVWIPTQSHNFFGDVAWLFSSCWPKNGSFQLLDEI